MNNNFFFTSESVTEGHPDKMADKISDAVLDAALSQDKYSRVACETMITTGFTLVAGEITTKAQMDVQDIVRDTIKSIGYDDSAKGYDYKTCGVMVSLDKQSPDIAQGVTSGEGLHKEHGAGDQGLMFGYATDETPALMPMPIYLAHKLTKELTRVRKEGILSYLRPDGKSQVTLEYENQKPKRVDCIVISSQHAENITHEQIKSDIIEKVIKPIIPAEFIDENTRFHINPTGQFIIGGPMGDCGLTGRKIIVDTYGGMGRHGGGCFSGKDPSKVDRSAAYAARYVAKNIIAAGLAKECEVQLSYAIGIAEPISININTFNTEQVDVKKLPQVIKEMLPLTPDWIIKELDLLRPIYSQTAAYGHFGRENKDFTWEATSLVNDLKNKFNL